MMFTHPSDRALMQLALHVNERGAERADVIDDRTHAHVTVCERCRARVDGDRRMLARVRGLPDTVDATDALLTRILGDRDAGRHVMMPPETASMRRAVTRPVWQILTGLAAAAVVVVLVGNWVASFDRTTQADASSVFASAAVPGGGGNNPPVSRVLPTEGTPRAAESASDRQLGQILSPWPTMAYAQSPGAARPTAYPAVRALDLSRLRTGVRNYLRSSANDYHEMLPHTLISVRTERATWRGRAVWRIVSTEPVRQNAAFADTLILSDSTLTPISRHTVSGMVSLREDYRDTLVINTFQVTLPPEMQKVMDARRSATNQSRRIDSFSTPKRVDTSRLVVSGYDGMRLVLQAARLSADWKASVSVIAKGLDSPTQVDPARGLTYLNMRVAGIDTVQLFNGRIECWRVLMETGPTPEVWHVSRETGETILTEGSWGPNYPESRNQLMGWHETKRIPPVRRR